MSRRAGQDFAAFAPDRTPVAGMIERPRVLLAGGAGRIRDSDRAGLVAARRYNWSGALRCRASSKESCRRCRPIVSHLSRRPKTGLKEGNANMTIRRIEVGPRMTHRHPWQHVYLAGQVGAGETVAEQTKRDPGDHRRVAARRVRTSRSSCRPSSGWTTWRTSPR